MKNSIILVVTLILLIWACNQVPKVEQVTTTKDFEFADDKYIVMGKKSIEDLAHGNIDNFLNALADNAVYKWNNGDSLVGKESIATYWRDRRKNVIDTITFTNDIWLTVKANESAKNVESGVYLLGWFDTSITYKTRKIVNISIHNVYHFDDNDKIDFVLQYLDRAPINAVMSKK